MNRKHRNVTIMIKGRRTRMSPFISIGDQYGRKFPSPPDLRVECEVFTAESRLQLHAYSNAVFPFPSTGFQQNQRCSHRRKVETLISIIDPIWSREYSYLACAGGLVCANPAKPTVDSIFGGSGLCNIEPGCSALYGRVLFCEFSGVGNNITSPNTQL